MTKMYGVREQQTKYVIRLIHIYLMNIRERGIHDNIHDENF